MVLRVEVPVELISWARERSGVSGTELARRFPKLREWEAGASSPTFHQLEDFANATHTPVGFFFLPEPPEEELPLPDFRTVRDEALRQPSVDLLDTLFEVQQRQEWYRDHVRTMGMEPLSFVGSFDPSTPSDAAARSLREALHFGVAERGSSWSEAFKRLTEAAEELRILVMVNGVVGGNTHRKLNPTEFRGFALVDDYAPVIFVNGADTKAAQIFTLAHELAHIWVGQSALSDVDVASVPENHAERWCNQVAAEILVPADMLQKEFSRHNDITAELDRLAARFKVSTLVVLRRLRDIRFLPWEQFRQMYDAEYVRVMKLAREQDGGSGGNFYNTQPVRTSKRFARAIVESAEEGATLYRDAFRLLGVKKLSTYRELANRLGVS
ncbi:Zn-dependent peptidase ImmA (M78 family)/transcriptional regulator with XRE-family HTH domain [Saccharothrix ecbatanensis]|uniref:Zn-dependent peptidase ImmA (M78 family)/transcriptional regulator with XRE-family HTH domain n=1 Tax=Saccharothrix ecbatanensis TaxID=1105145 RepID=A0A7W9M420_9PSEU|nr:ImmA/IrrE family metallo-endopeptidase [Saccharothrix ecbatanensis]MBB5806652.1 Zn-dependent peptidase ImmA (M78 family)/transcriptional regulator with XRE-family HTH domain [Saccharothrix ecbatanensis]